MHAEYCMWLRGRIGNARLGCYLMRLPIGLQAYPWAPDMLAIINWWAGWSPVRKMKIMSTLHTPNSCV